MISEKSGVVGVGYAHGYLHALLMFMCMHPSVVAFLADGRALAQTPLKFTLFSIQILQGKITSDTLSNTK